MDTPMNVAEVIAEIDRLPPEERLTVMVHLRVLEEEAIPDSFILGLQEAKRGELTVMEEGHFTTQPAA